MNPRASGPDQARTPLSIVTPVYARLAARTQLARKRLGRPLTFAEKVLFNHLDRPEDQELCRAESYADFVPDRVALQDALAQIVALQFMTAGLDSSVIPTTVHCDHLIRAREAASPDLARALDDNAEVYEFLKNVAARYGFGFWAPGSGIIHQVVFERYAFPGGMMVGTDSHTPNAGGLGMAAVGVGGGDAIDVMTGLAFNLRWPKLIGVRLSGALSGWASPKDVILQLASLLTVRGGTGAILEYFGPGVETISATGRGTICNMGAEVGATTSMFPFDESSAAFLTATGRDDIADAARSVARDLRADDEVEAEPDRFFDQVIEIDLSSLVPLLNGPDTPDLSHTSAEIGSWARDHGVPTQISSALIGSCTNSSYEDITRAASVARQAAARGLRAKTTLFITPGSEQIRATIERDGMLDDFNAIGATVLANACGPCIGQWERQASDFDQPNTIVNSYNRNFPKRNDGSDATKAFVTSPDMVVAYALAGTLAFDPLQDALLDNHGNEFRLDPPEGTALPARGFDPGQVAFVAPTHTRRPAEVRVSAGSERLQLLQAFPEWDGSEYVDMPVLVKARGKCTTDHISAAGQWLRYRGHLENISGNLFAGVVNAFTGSAGTGKDPLDGTTRTFPEMAKHLSQAGVRWCVVGDTNYGEGSSREHAAMEPRYRGGVAVFARSFARIHETNLKKQGMLALTFVDPATYDAIAEDDRLSVLGLGSLTPGRPVRCRITHAHGASTDFECSHTLTAAQLEWFKAGSALNVIRRRTLNRGDAPPTPPGRLATARSE